MDIPDAIRDAVERAVTGCLATEMETRGLLLAADRFAAAETQAASDGERLLTSVIHHCYPLSEYDTQVLTLEFDSELEASRVRSALAFGSATAALLMSPLHDDPGSVGLLSAIFNLGIGLVDGVCDDDAGTGLRLLELIEVGNVSEAARQPRPRGWLRVQLPAELESDPSVSFAADIVETFFATLHAVYAGGPWLQLRGQVGGQLAAALQAERASLVASSADASREQLTRYSYATSVLPFEIVGTLTLAGHATGADRFIGEAMWRIDDLVDLCDDARTGALNAILLTAIGSGGDALEWLLASDHIARAAADAADSLRRGIELAACRGGTRCRDVFLQFVARYAGIVPREVS
ncbi:MAG TPA: hypothetical protein VLD86_03950 [Ilumatobacteraceae bacterium]|nr:hypothetical protein [Ilumatobacteraceae bacterium]